MAPVVETVPLVAAVSAPLPESVENAVNGWWAAAEWPEPVEAPPEAAAATAAATAAGPMGPDWWECAAGWKGA